MTSIYRDIPSENIESQDDSVNISVSEEIIQQGELQGYEPDILVHETFELQTTTGSNSDISSESSSFSISYFLGRLSINLILPFINGLMLGFGEIIAHEIGFHYNWSGAKVSFMKAYCAYGTGNTNFVRTGLPSKKSFREEK